MGAKVCGSCHADIYASQQKSGHARALVRAHKDSPVRAEWAFGAGDQAVTFVSQADEDHYVEHGLSYYTRAKGTALTPGHRSADGERYRTFDPSAAILRCFQCHSTGPLRMEAGFRLDPSEPGVHCESCHGPGGGHPPSAMRNPKRLSAAELNDLCGACHRMPPSAGDATDWSNPWNTRHQPLYFSQSACFKKSGGRISCVTCHSPHEAVSRDSSKYDQTCRSCHSAPKHQSPVASKSCVSCHMPAVEPGPYLRFANHWIGVYSSTDHLRPKR